MPTSLSTSNYNDRAPACVFSTDTDDNVILTVSNLRTSGLPTPPFYGLYFTGLTTGPSARSSQIDGDSSTGTQATLFVAVTAKETINANNFVFNYVDKSSGVTLVGDPATNGVESELQIDFSVVQLIPIDGSLVIVLPYQNYQYEDLGIAPLRSMVISSSSISATGTYKSGTTTKTLSPSIDIDQQTSGTYVNILLGNTAIIPNGAVLTVTINELLMPPSLKPMDGIEVFSGDSDYYKIEYATYMEISNTDPGDQFTTDFTSVAAIETLTGVMEEDQTYSFSVYMTGDLPMDSYFTLQIPTSVGLPTDDVNGLTLTCTVYCDEDDITMTYTSATRLITFTGVVPDESSYITAPGALQFQIQGFTNPATSTAAFFTWTSYAVIDSGTYMIDQISSMFIASEQGECTIEEFYPTDDNYMIYGVAESWTITMYCEHAFDSTYGIRITLPTDWYIIETSTCVMTGQSSTYDCESDNDAGTITITEFLDESTEEEEEFTFTINSIRNPTVTGSAYSIEFEIVSETDGAVDLGSFDFDEDLIVTGEVWSFTAVPEDYGVGQYPVNYNFAFQPSGEIYKKSYIVITLPDEVTFFNEREVERTCTYDIDGFTTTRINCKVNGNKITINSGFTFLATTIMTDDDDSMVPPVIEFTLPQFWNQRTMSISGAFGLSVFSEDNDEIYTWDPTYDITVNGVESEDTTEGPSVLMKTAATPQSITIDRGSTQNGVVTDYNFTVRATNFLVEGDQIIIELPSPVSFSEDSKCLGMTRNMRINQTYTVSVKLDAIQITLLLPLNFRMLQAGSTNKIGAGESFTFTLTNIKNPYSTSPTDSSVIYSTYTGGLLIEQMSTGLIITNTIPGFLEASTGSIVPKDFKQSFTTNYTLNFKPVNYQQNMYIVLRLPIQVQFGQDGVGCYGAQGTDAIKLTCTLNLKQRTVNITDAVQYQKGNPGQIQIVFDSFKNPSKNLVTDSFQLRTFTNNGYLLDFLVTDLVVNFFCQYPCASCPKNQKDVCESCYGGDKFPIFYKATCLEVCPSGWTNTTTNNCTACASPCAECSLRGNTCTACIEGYQLKGEKCLESIFWPFPFLITGAVQFLIILISEICTRTQSRFKEASIALLAIPEMGAWITFLVFHQQRQGIGGSFALGAIALGLYAMINFVHAIVHPRRIYPKAMSSYKALYKNYCFSTFLMRMVSYFVSYKFSLLLVSYLCMRPRFKGDYSAVNWKSFNRFSLAFICLPFPIMIFACAYFLYIEELFSYASYVAIEVVVISTFAASFMIIDAISALKCKTKAQKQDGNKVVTGADYESEDDDQGKRIRKKQKWREHIQDEFGADESRQPIADVDSQSTLRNQARDIVSGRSDIASQISGNGRNELSEETKRQIFMLEELARQMREEKEQLRLERERIERERAAMRNDETASKLLRMQNYMNSDDGRSQKDKDVEVTEFDDQTELSDIRKQQEMRLKRRNYRDIEGEEMQDYDVIDEAQASDEQQVTEGAEIPVPVQGQTQYSRSNEGSEQQWVKQVTPRAGGDSIIGPDDLQENQIFKEGRETAIYAEGTNNPSQFGQREEFVQRSNASFSITNAARQKDGSEVYQMRSDAQMEVNSDLDLANSQQQFFIKEDAFYSEHGYNKSVAASELNIAAQKALFSNLGSENHTLHGSEKYFFAQESAVKGDTVGILSKYEGSVEHFIRKSDAAYGDYAQEGSLHREGTPMQFFDGDQPSQGDATDYERTMQASQDGQFISQEPPVQNRHQSWKESQAEDNDPHGNSNDQDSKNYGRDGNNVAYYDKDGNIIQDPNASRNNGAYYDKDGNIIKDPNATSYNGVYYDKDGNIIEDPNVAKKIGTYYDKDGNIIQDFNGTSYNGSYYDKDGNIIEGPNATRKKGGSSNRESVRLSQNFIEDEHNGLSGNKPDTNDYDKAQIDAQKRKLSREQSERRQDLPSSELQYHGTDDKQSSYYNQQNRDAGEYDDSNSHQRRVAEEEMYEDQSGHSESSEGIVDHNPFTSAAVIIKKISKVQIGEALKQTAIDAQQKKKAMELLAPKKQILYSDKSESSVDDLMGDTPSNYNVLNGRLDGISAGLKQLVNKGKLNDPTINQETGVKKVSPRVPQAPQSQNIKGVQRTNEQEERKFVSNLRSNGGANGSSTLDRSIEGGWGNVSQPYGSKNRVQVIGEEVSADEYTSGGGLAIHKKQKAIKTNKQFAEGSRNNSQQKNKTPAPALRQNNRLDSKTRRNNFI